MELIDRINGLDKEMDMVKSEIKKVLVDVRETMNLAENPFAHLGEVQQAGTRGVDEARIKTLEDTIAQLQELSGSNTVDESRIKTLEDSIAQVKSLSGSNTVDESRIKTLEDTIAQLQELSGGNTVDESRIKTLEDSIAQLTSLSGNNTVDESRIKTLEDSIAQLTSLSGNNTVDESRIKTLEDTIAQLTSLSGNNTVDESRIKTLENSIAQLASLSADNTVDESRIKTLEDSIEQLKVIKMSYENDGEMFKKLENSMQELETQGTIEVEKLKNLEAAIEVLGETKTQSPSGIPLFHNKETAESERNRLIAELGEEFAGETWDGIIDTLMLAQLIQWADYSLNLIGIEQVNHVIDLYELTGRLSREMKDAILKIIELPAAYLNTKNEEVEAKHCIIALFELDRIITGEHQELVTLLRDMS